ncbi:MAG: ATP-binding protein [Candidatus Eisenbacteria bacterium]|uniref:ATP-binding protein n=1 Tax=Eiseniibacteriota bacterium TaxID=2212470 RepID=A0A948RXZ9_UNCEI|nr:ATP-binding protein [Candidatus Eisenbacteria bacterium]MBU1948433.1 ATP-binding protein [Candidatus Eisenbacteria bacterium]MBU2692910.1 ATP-binding protein [Candidatus Eisenbacteria bacterium]
MSSSTEGPNPNIVPEADSGNRMVLYLPSDLNYLSVVDRMVEGIAEMLELEEEDNIAVATSVIEACTNAIQHGHRQEAAKYFFCSFYLGENELQVTVKDWGPGFNLNTVLGGDPTHGEGLLKCRGRGIFIMRSMMDTVEFEMREPIGTTVKLTKQLARRGTSSPVSG